MHKMNLQFKKLVADAKIPQFATLMSAGLDLCSIQEDFELAAGAGCMVKTGLAVVIPSGFGGFVCPRSGLAAKHGITVTNAPGTIDSDYRGEVCVLLTNLGKVPYKVSYGDRIAQLIIMPVMDSRAIEITEVTDELEATARGTGGFGSTGA